MWKESYMSYKSKWRQISVCDLPPLSCISAYLNSRLPSEEGEAAFDYLLTQEAFESWDQ